MPGSSRCRVAWATARGSRRVFRSSPPLTRRAPRMLTRDARSCRPRQNEAGAAEPGRQGRPGKSEPGRACLRPPAAQAGLMGPATMNRASRIQVAPVSAPAAQAGLTAPATMKRNHSILVVDDEKTIADGLRLTLESEGYGVRTAGSVREALTAVLQGDSHAAIVDLMLPDGDGLHLTRELKRRDPAIEVIVITAYGSVRKAMEATKGAGAFHVLEKPFDPDELLGLIENALEHRKLVGENADLKRRLVEQVTETEILGSAPGIQRVLETVAAVADADANILIVGESGTGKELLANALHERSGRRGGPWIKINCAALPKDLIESELFGHTRGAFTGATTEKVGLLEEADGGSLLLDEITEMPMDLQAKLLRVLEERMVRRLGAAK